MIIVERGHQSVLAGGNILARHLADATGAQQFRRLGDDAVLDLAADHPTAHQEGVEPPGRQIDDGEPDRALRAEAVLVFQQDDSVVAAGDEALDVGDLIAPGRQVELVRLLRHLGGTRDMVGRVDVQAARDAELGQESVEVELAESP